MASEERSPKSERGIRDFRHGDSFCVLCGFELATATALCTHLQEIHWSDKAQCPWPGCQTFHTWEAKKNMHIRQHVRPAKCICGAAFQQDAGLMKHVRASRQGNHGPVHPSPPTAPDQHLPRNWRLNAALKAADLKAQAERSIDLSPPPEKRQRMQPQPQPLPSRLPPFPPPMQARPAPLVRADELVHLLNCKARDIESLANVVSLTAHNERGQSVHNILVATSRQLIEEMARAEAYLKS